MAMDYPTKIELIHSDGVPVQYTVTDGTGIVKYAVLTLSDPRTAAIVSGTDQNIGYVCAGIAAMEKVASDGATTITAWTNGIFKLKASGAIAVGVPIKSCGNGRFMASSWAEMSSGVICGKSLETAADGETFAGWIKI